jgi:hypothetical protein
VLPFTNAALMCGQASGGLAPGYSTQWRVFIYTSLSGTAFASISELELRGSVGGANLATGGTPSADSFNSSTGGFVANAFDGNSSTFWQSSAASGWLQYTTASPITVNEVAITVGSAVTNGGPAWFDVQYYDGATWITKFTGYTTSWATTTQTFSGQTLGTERVTDPGFDNPASWTTSGGWSISGSNAVAASASNSLVQSGVFVNGHSYAIQFDYNKTAGSALRIRTETFGRLFITPALANGSGTIRATFLADGTQFRLEASSAVFTGSLPSISVKEIL